jgi:hypothetical protein
MSRSLTLLLPHDPAAVQQRLPALETLLARGERRCDQPADWQRRLLQLCGVTTTAQQDLPLGPLCCLGDGGAAADGYWLRAEPVHLVADQDKVYLAARGSELSLTAEEAAALTAEFNALFHEDGWQLWAPAPDRWYLRLPQAPQLRTHAPDHAVGCDVRPLLPQGADGMRMQAALNEIQMLFHASGVNARRLAEGRPAVNSLWLWGGGLLPVLAPLPWERLQGEDCLLRGIAARAGVAGTAPPDGAEAWLGVAAGGMVLFDAELHPMGALERDWFAPLLAALRSGTLMQLEIHLTATACRYHVDRRSARRWWRRRRPLAMYAGST